MKNYEILYVFEPNMIIFSSKEEVDIVDIINHCKDRLDSGSRSYFLLNKTSMIMYKATINKKCADIEYIVLW